MCPLFGRLFDSKNTVLVFQVQNILFEIVYYYLTTICLWFDPLLLIFYQIFDLLIKSQLEVNEKSILSPLLKWGGISVERYCGLQCHCSQRVHCMALDSFRKPIRNGVLSVILKLNQGHCRWLISARALQVPVRDENFKTTLQILQNNHCKNQSSHFARIWKIKLFLFF